MATGIVHGEKLSKDAISSENYDEEFPLPSESSTAELKYPNKIEPEKILNSPVRQLKECKSGKLQVADSLELNLLLLSDNYYGMKFLGEKYYGKVNLVYLDPPFQTGMEFQSRQLQHAYKDLMAPATYLEFMRRRLILIKELLAQDGSIYLHIGHQMVFHIKVLMDEIFGASNFRNLITRRKCSSKNYTKNQYPNLNDYILFYSKSKKYKFFPPQIIPTQGWIEKEYPKIDTNTGRRFKLVPVHAPGTRKGETGMPWKGMKPPPGKHWQMKPSTLDELDQKGDIHWSKNGNPRRKVWLTEDKTVPRTDYWEDYRDAHHQSIKITGYPTEKNLKMIETIIASATTEGDIVMDPFCGSGTTLHAAENQNRKWIGIDSSFTAFECIFSRFNEGLKPMGDYVNKHEQMSIFSGEQINTTSGKPRLFIDNIFQEKHADELAKLLDKWCF